jgi:hypothetical protein
MHARWENMHDWQITGLVFRWQQTWVWEIWSGIRLTALHGTSPVAFCFASCLTAIYWTFWTVSKAEFIVITVLHSVPYLWRKYRAKTYTSRYTMEAAEIWSCCPFRRYSVKCILFWSWHSNVQMKLAERSSHRRSETLLSEITGPFGGRSWAYPVRHPGSVDSFQLVLPDGQTTLQ